MKRTRSEDAATEKVHRITRVLPEVCLGSDTGCAVAENISMALYPRDGSIHQSLFRKSCLAHYDVKSHGRNGFHVFTRILMG